MAFQWPLAATTRTVYQRCPHLRTCGLSSTQAVATYFLIASSPDEETLFAAMDSWLALQSGNVTALRMEGFLVGIGVLQARPSLKPARATPEAIKLGVLLLLGYQRWTPARRVKEPRRLRWLPPGSIQDRLQSQDLDALYKRSYSPRGAWTDVQKHPEFDSVYLRVRSAIDRGVDPLEGFSP